MKIDPAGMEAHAAKAADFLKLLASEQRLMILCALLHAPRTVGELVRDLRLRQPNVSQHIAKLRAAGVVEPLRRGVMVRYRLADSDVRPIIAKLQQRFCA